MTNYTVKMHSLFTNEMLNIISRVINRVLCISILKQNFICGLLRATKVVIQMPKLTCESPNLMNE